MKGSSGETAGAEHHDRTSSVFKKISDDNEDFLKVF